MVMIYRTIIMYAFVILTMRLMGKRQMGELELNELVVAVMISEMAAIPIVEEGQSIIHGIIPIATLLVCELLVSFTALKSIKFRILISGTPSIIVKDGKINQKELRKNRFTLDELTEELRTQGITDISTIKYAILETDGSLNVILFNEHLPVKNKSMNIGEKDNGLPLFIINDGRILTNNLKILGLDESWLKNELKRRKIKNPKDVFLLSVDECGNIYFAQKE